MITDNLKSAEKYFGLGERIAKGLKYLKDTDFTNVDDGNYPLEGANLFAIVSSYTTKTANDSKTENHKNYIDIQYIIKGRELMGYVFYNEQEPSMPYNPEKDVAFYTCETSKILFEKGSFAIFFPHDIHTPGIMVDGPEQVRKVVVKVRVS